MEQSLELIRAFWPIFSAIVVILFLGLVWALKRSHKLDEHGEKISTIMQELKSIREDSESSISEFAKKHDSDIKAIYTRVESIENKIFDEISRVKELTAELRGFLYSGKKTTIRK